MSFLHQGPHNWTRGAQTRPQPGKTKLVLSQMNFLLFLLPFMWALPWPKEGKALQREGVSVCVGVPAADSCFAMCWSHLRCCSLNDAVAKTEPGLYLSCKSNAVWKSGKCQHQIVFSTIFIRFWGFFLPWESSSMILKPFNIALTTPSHGKRCWFGGLE